MLGPPCSPINSSKPILPLTTCYNLSTAPPPPSQMNLLFSTFYTLDNPPPAPGKLGQHGSFCFLAFPGYLSVFFPVALPLFCPLPIDRRGCLACLLACQLSRWKIVTYCCRASNIKHVLYVCLADGCTAAFHAVITSACQFTFAFRKNPVLFIVLCIQISPVLQNVAVCTCLHISA